MSGGSMHYCSAVPPFLFENIERNGSEAQRARAREAMRLSQTHRGRRLMHAMVQRPFRVHPRVRWFEFMKARMAAAPECEKERRIYDAQHMQRLPGRLVRSE